jgi:ribosome modulation factor
MTRLESRGYEDGFAGRGPRPKKPGNKGYERRRYLTGWYRGADDRRRLPDDQRERRALRAAAHAAFIARQASAQLDLVDLVARAA